MTDSLLKSDTETIADRLNKSQMYQQLDRLVGLSAADWQTILRYLSVETVPPRYCLQAVGSPVKKHYFITQGLVRLFYITPEGKDINKGFYSEGHIAGSLSGLILREPSRFGIETLEACTLIAMNLENFDDLMKTCDGWARIFNHSCEMMLIRNERREAELLSLSSKARFLQFVKNFGADMARIPQYHIASYLGITPTALSRYKDQWLQQGS